MLLESAAKHDLHLHLLKSLAVVWVLQDSMTQLFTMMFGDVQFSTLKTIMNVNTVSFSASLARLPSAHLLRYSVHPIMCTRGKAQIKPPRANALCTAIAAA